MKTLGIVGGIGPESTIDYYKLLVSRYRERSPANEYPSVVINSIEASRVLRMLYARDLSALAGRLVEAVRQLELAGADFGLIAANTPHLVFDEVARASRLPLISIVEAARDAAVRLGRTKLALFGTQFTMEAGFYDTLFAKSGMEIVVPEAEERAFIHQKYMEELFAGRFLPETREGLVSIIAAMRERAAVDAVILGGTELPLILRESDYGGVQVLNTTMIHVDAAIDRMLADNN
jgi:aspartate racemase